MEIVDPTAQAYAERYSSGVSELLQEIASYTAANHPEAHMLSGPLQGKLLEMISKLLRPKRILEVGTFMGYSALCLASGMAEGGELHTIELRDADADRAEGYFRRSKWDGRIILHRGNALAIIPALEEVWDIVFIDADKPGYVDYYNLVLPKLKSGGLIIADNVLFHGQVLGALASPGNLRSGAKHSANDGPSANGPAAHPAPVMGKSALGIQAFNELVAGDDRVEKVMLTVRDGLFFIRKKK